jgi:hypothetical protein
VRSRRYPLPRASQSPNALQADTSYAKSRSLAASWKTRRDTSSAKLAPLEAQRDAIDQPASRRAYADHSFASEVSRLILQAGTATCGMYEVEPRSA